MKRFYSLVIPFFVMLADLVGQTPQFSQFYANQIYLNPAFTGNTAVNRIAGNYRNQWAGVSAFNSYSLAYDHNLAAYNMGVGLLAIRDQAGTGGLSYTNFSALAAYKFQVVDEIMINAGISYGLSIRATDPSRYTFGDQLVNGGATNANIMESNTYGDFGFGYLVYNSKFWGGMSALHLNRPNESLIPSQTSRMPVLWSLHGGYNFALDATEKGEILKSVIPTVNYKFSKRFDQLDLGAYYQRKMLIMGLWFRGLTFLKRNEDGTASHDAVVLLIGMKSKSTRIGYSYDITTSKLQVSNSYGSHEISITYEWPTKERKKKKRKKSFIVPCPKF